MGYLFQVKIYEWPHFSIFSLWLTKFFGHPCLRALFCWHTQLRKSKYLYINVYRSKFCTIKYINGSLFSKAWYMNGSLFRLPGIWMGYVLKYRAARPYQNYLRVTPPPPRDLNTRNRLNTTMMIFKMFVRHQVELGHVSCTLSYSGYIPIDRISRSTNYVDQLDKQQSASLRHLALLPRGVESYQGTSTATSWLQVTYTCC